jgi:elongation factor P
MRRLSDGVKTVQRYRTTEQVERAFVEDREHTYLYQDGDGYVFMNPETYEQVTVSKDVMGDEAVYLQEGMPCMVSVFEGNAVAIDLPQRVTLEVIDTEPVTKGQTASSSYKPAKLSNGVRSMVPPPYRGRDQDRGPDRPTAPTSSAPRAEPSSRGGRERVEQRQQERLVTGR